MNSEPAKHNPFEPLGLSASHGSVVVAGLGITGLSTVLFLNRHGIACRVVDSRTQPPGLNELIAQAPDIEYHCGDFDPSQFISATHIVVSPGIALEEPAIKQALDHGLRLISDIDLFACMTSEPIIAITGSNGKSTVTTLVGLMAQQAGLKVGVGGNLGTPVLDLLADDADGYVLELSSFQLERTTELKPEVATVLNISPDHLDRYSSLADYAAQKARIFHHCRHMVLNMDDPLVSAMSIDSQHPIGFSLTDNSDYQLSLVDGESWLVNGERPLLAVKQLRMVGRHNIANALAALAIGDAVALPLSAMQQVLRTFSGLDHRMQWIAEINGIDWINDSKATNVGACQAALEGLDNPAILIAGGDGKGGDFTELRAVFQQKVRTAVLIGRDADRLEQALHGTAPMFKANSMQDAVRLAHAAANPGDTVLLSPACASLDQYRNYQQRGDCFAAAVRELA